MVMPSAEIRKAGERKSFDSRNEMFHCWHVRLKIPTGHSIEHGKQ